MIEDQEFKSQSFQQGLPDRSFAYCEFINCDLSQVNLHGCSFEECQFIDCNFSGALIAKTAFKTVDFKACKLTGLEFKDASPFLLQMTFDQCQLELANFYALDIKGISFKGCQMKSVDFTEANLEGAQFIDCDLTAAIFEGCNLQKANFKSAYNFSIKAEQNRMNKAQFSQDNLQGLLEHLNLDIS